LQTVIIIEKFLVKPKNIAMTLLRKV